MFVMAMAVVILTVGSMPVVVVAMVTMTVGSMAMGPMSVVPVSLVPLSVLDRDTSVPAPTNAAHPESSRRLTRVALPVAPTRPEQGRDAPPASGCYRDPGLRPDVPALT